MNKSIYTEEKGKYYNEHNTWHVEDSPWKANHIFNIIKKNNIYPKTIVDIGCGAGEVSKELQLLMPDDVLFSGYEISPDAYNLSKKRENDRLKFYNNNLLNTNNEFDLLLMIDVFEHVEDYLGFLKASKSKSTFKIFHIPLDINVFSVLVNSFLSERRGNGHLHYFTKESALETLRDSGYEIIDFAYTQYWSRKGMVKKRSFKDSIIYLLKKVTYKLSVPIAVRLFGGSSLLVLAK